MYEGDDRGPFHLTVVPDLRGCRVTPINSTDRSAKCLELSNPSQGLELRLLPVVKAEYDLWLAALICWQQIRSETLQTSPPRSAAMGERRPSAKRRDSGFNHLKETGKLKRRQYNQGCKVTPVG